MPDFVPAAAGPTRHFLTFRLDDRLYALPAGDIAEVIRIPAVARMPQSPDALLGLANLRGEILPLASGRRLLGQKGAGDTGQGRAIVMNGAAPVAFAVDAVTALVELSENEIEKRETELAALPGELLTGTFQLNKTGSVIKLLDIKALLNAAFVARARPQRRLRQTGSNAAIGETIDARATRAKLLSFAIAGQDYALPLETVREIVAAPSLLVGIPHSEALALGVTSLRDTLLPVLSLRGLLGFAPNPEPQMEKVIVAMIQGHVVGLVVDKMQDIFSADESRIDPIPGVLAARTGGESRIVAIYRGHDRRGLVSILSPEQIFGEDVTKRLIDTQKAEAPDDLATGDARTSQYLVFRLGEEEYGLPIGAVEEVARVPDKIARIPNTPKFLEGVINLRGEVIPVVDQRKRFQMPPLDGAPLRRLVIVRTQRHIAGLIVDGVSEVLQAAADDIDVAPDLTGESNRLVIGVVNLDRQKRIVLLLDPAELLTRAERGLLDKFAKQHDAPNWPGT